MALMRLDCAGVVQKTGWLPFASYLKEDRWVSDEPMNQAPLPIACLYVPHPVQEAMQSPNAYCVASSSQIIPEQPTGFQLTEKEMVSQMSSNLFLETEEAWSGYYVPFEPGVLTPATMPSVQRSLQSSRWSSFLTSALLFLLDDVFYMAGYAQKSLHCVPAGQA